MAGAAAPVGDDRAGALHHGFPIRVGHVGDQHIARLNLVHVLDVVHDADRAGADFLANGAARGQHGALGLVGLEAVTHLGLAFGLAFHRFGPGLQDVKLTINAIFSPLDVHGAAVVVFNDQGVPGQLLHVGVTQ